MITPYQFEFILHQHHIFIYNIFRKASTCSELTSRPHVMVFHGQPIAKSGAFLDSLRRSHFLDQT